MRAAAPFSTNRRLIGVTTEGLLVFPWREDSERAESRRTLGLPRGSHTALIRMNLPRGDPAICDGNLND